MGINIFSVKAKSQAGNTWVRDMMTTQKGQSHSARDLESLHILLGNSAEHPRSRREHWWSYIVSVFENTPKNWVVQGRAQLEHSSHKIMVGVKATC